MNSPKPIVPSVTSVQNEVPQINGYDKKADMTGYLVHCAHCYAADYCISSKTRIRNNIG